MRILSAALVFFTIALFVSSCQQEIDGSSGNNILTNSDSTYIKQLVVLDTHYVSGIDSFLRWDLSYNTDKKLARLFYTGYDHVAGPGRIMIYEDLSYKYQGTNPYPEYIIDSVTDFSSPTRRYADTTFFYYSNGVVVRDSTTAEYGGSPYYTVNEFTSLGTGRYKLITKRPDLIAGGIKRDSTHVFVDWQNGNLLKEIDSLWIPGLGSWQVSTTTISYDAKSNPFRQLAIPYPAPVNENLPSTGIQALFLPGKNNMIMKTDRSGTYILNYEYNTGSLPKIARDQAGLKIFYSYTAL